MWKKLASKTKKRTRDLGYNFDMSSITPRILSMSYPYKKECHSVFYKNEREQVKAYFDLKYGKQHYMVVNLCAESDMQYLS
jgi:hypothetical protein